MPTIESEKSLLGKIADEIHRAEIVEREFNRIIENLDKVFQGNDSLLPDFLMLGDCKSEGAIKLAEAYLKRGALLRRIESLCQRSNTPSVNVGAHELAGKILKLIQQWEER